MKKTIYKLLLIFTLIFVINACDENAIPIVTEPLPENASVGKFFFYSPHAPATNIYFNNTKISAIASSSDDKEKGRKYKSVYPSNAYAILPTGNFTVKVKDLDGIDIVSKDLTFDAKKRYSIFFLGDSLSPEIFQLEDVHPPVDVNQIYWRFVNTLTDIPFSLDAYAIRAEVAATDTTPYEPVQVISLGNAIGYKQATGYTVLEPGRYTIKTFENGTMYDPETSTAFLSHSVNLVSENRVYSTQILGVYSDSDPDSADIDYWRER